MALILSIETADKGCSVALHENGALIDSATEKDSKSSSSLLTTLIADIFVKTNKNYGDLDAVAISKGPGSYTGLRIGVSTAKGFCYALDLPLISVNTLDIVAEGLLETIDTDVICPMLDARRMEVYCKVLSNKPNFELIPTSALVVEEESFNEILKEKTVLFCGPGAVKCKEVLGVHLNANFEEQPTAVHAKNMGDFAYKAFKNKQFEDLAYFEPFYLKDFLVKKSQKKMPLDNSK